MGLSKFQRITKGISLTSRQAQSIQRQIKAGVKTPTLTVGGLKINLDEYRLANKLIDTPSTGYKKKFKPERLKYKDGVYTNPAGVSFTKSQIAAIRKQERTIRDYARREQIKATVKNIREVAKQNTELTQYEPTKARRAPFKIPHTKFSEIKSIEEKINLPQNLKLLYDPKTKISYRQFELNNILVDNFKKSIAAQYDPERAEILIDALSQVSNETLSDLMSSGALTTPGDIYVANDKLLDEYFDTIIKAIEEATQDDNTIDSEDIGL